MIRARLRAARQAVAIGVFLIGSGAGAGPVPSYPVVDTGQTGFFDDSSTIRAPAPGEPFYGQDAHYLINPPSYTDNEDGTVTDNVSGLTWQRQVVGKMTFEDAFGQARRSQVGGYRDWRVPSLKELYSLIQFTGQVANQRAIRPFIDTFHFEQPLGSAARGERQIDAQTWSATEYVGATMRNDETVFGVNFVDGRIKGYPKYDPRTGAPARMYVRFVRGNPRYGVNHFVDNHDGTISDLATGLMWQKDDSSFGMDWQEALKYASELVLAGHHDWRLPNAKELHSIVDYSRSPQTHGSPAIDPLFDTTAIRDPEGHLQYPYFWTGTTHFAGRNPYDSAVYIAFGAAQGFFRGSLMDVHGAGSQRSDPKSGDPADYPQPFGPQGDLRYVYNFVRCVRSIGD